MVFHAPPQEYNNTSTGGLFSLDSSGTVSQSVTTTLLEQGAHGPHSQSHSTLVFFFQVCGGCLCIFQCRCIFFFLLEEVVVHFRMVFCSFHLLPIFLLAQIL